MRLLHLSLCLASLYAAAPPASASVFNHRPAEARVTERLKAGDNVALAAESFDQMFDVAEKLLARRGYQDDADQLAAEWARTYRPMMTALGDTGDHAPLSEWVAEWYAKLEAILGVRLMEISHLRDLWVLNFSIPVVFNPNHDNDWCAETLFKHPMDTCKAEYRRHFAGTKYQTYVDPYATLETHHGFGGVVTYWVVWGACEAATYGTGWFLVCSPAGDLAEIGVEKWVAPKASDALYDRAND